MGQKSAAYDAQGNITAFYDSADSPPPQGAQVLAITDAQWQAAISASGYTVVNGALTPPAPPTAAQQLAQAQAAQIGVMYAAYQAAIAQDIVFTTAAGTVKTYQADDVSRKNAGDMVAAYGASGVPAGFYWVAKDNTQVPFTLADLQGLAKTMGDQGWASFKRLQDRKATINAATTIPAVQAVAW